MTTKVKEQQFISLVERLASLLQERNYTLSIAESCTGGLLGHTLTNLAGSSSWFKGGVIAYANEIKERVLNVDQNILKQNGAVSAKCVHAMVKGVTKLFNTETGIAFSGIAGPGGGSPLKPVGTVYAGFYLKDRIWTQKFFFSGSREEIKSQTVYVGLNELILLLQKSTSSNQV